MLSFRLQVVLAALPVAILIAGGGFIALYTRLRRGTGHRFLAAASSELAVAAAVTVLFDAYWTRFNTGGVFIATGGRSPIAPGALQFDRFSLVGAMIACGAAIVLPLLCNPLYARNPRHAGFHHALTLVAAGAVVLLSEQLEMVSMLVGLGLLGACLIGIMSLATTEWGVTRAAHSVAVIVSVALAVIAYGCVVLYGTTGSTSFTAVPLAFHAAPLLVSLGVALLLLGLVALVCAGPLGGWHHNLAEQVDTPALVSWLVLAVPGIFVILVRLTQTTLADHVWWWPSVIAVMGTGTALLAALRALRSRSLRSIIVSVLVAQIGVAVASVAGFGHGIVGVQTGGASAVMLQVVALMVAAVGALGVLVASEAAGVDDIETLPGLAARLGPIGGYLVIALAGVTALPPLGLFVAQTLGLSALINSGQVWVAVVLLATGILLGLAVIRPLGIALEEPRAGDADVSLGWSWAQTGLVALAAVAGIAVLLLTGPLLNMISSGTAVLGG